MGMGQGWADLGAGIAAGITGRRERKEERKRLSARLAATDDWAERKDELEALSLADLQALEDQHTMKRAEELHKAKMAESGGRQGLMNEELAYLQETRPARVRQTGAQAALAGTQMLNAKDDRERQKAQQAAVLEFLKNSSDAELGKLQEFAQAGGQPPMELLAEYLTPGFAPQFSEGPGGALGMTTSKRSAVPVRQPKTAEPALQELKVGKKTYYVGPGNKYFDEAGEPVDLGGGGGAAPLFGPGAAAGGGSMSEQDRQALEWARANPSDPRAAQILKRLGVAQ